MPVVSSCGICKYRFTYVDCPVKCDGCSQFVHGKCSKLSIEEMKCLSSKNRILKFFCILCEPDSSRSVDIGWLNVQRSVNILNVKNYIFRPL